MPMNAGLRYRSIDGANAITALSGVRTVIVAVTFNDLALAQ